MRDASSLTGPPLNVGSRPGAPASILAHVGGATAPSLGEPESATLPPSGRAGTGSHHPPAGAAEHAAIAHETAVRAIHMAGRERMRVLSQERCHRARAGIPGRFAAA